MRNASVFLIFFLIGLISIAHAVALPDLTSMQAMLKSNPEFAKNLSAIYSVLNVKFPPNSTLASTNQQGLIIKGEHAGVIEEQLYSLAKSNYPILNQFTEVNINSVDPNKIFNQKNTTIILIGGPSENKLTQYIEDKGLANYTARLPKVGIIKMARIPNGADVIIVSDLKGYDNIRMVGIENSPLVALGIPPQFVPPVAVAISLLLVALWPRIMTALTDFIGIFVSGFARKKVKEGKKVSSHNDGFKFFGFHIVPIELLAIFGAALVYGLAVSYTFKGLVFDIQILEYAIGFSIILYYARTLVGMIIANIYKLHSEFRLWPSGCGICLVGAFLGTPLETTGYELAEESHENHTKFAKMEAFVILITFAIALVIFIINFIHPTEPFEVFRAIASGVALAEIMPFKPMPGVSIKKWNWIIWLILFLLIVPTYFLINFYL